MAAMVVGGRRGAGLAEFKRVVRVAVNFLPGPGGGGGGFGGREGGGVKGRGQNASEGSLASATYLSTIFYQ